MALNQNEPRSTKVQMSEAFITSVFLALSGGFQDAYTYFTRDGVFSNAQTGNVVLMSQHFMMGEWSEGLRYLFPLLAFAVGVFVAERIQGSFKYARKLHWRQSVLLCEMAILVFVGFLPENLNMAASLKMEAARSIREDFLHQNSFHEIDTYTPLRKQYLMMKLVLAFYEKSVDALNKGADMNALIAMPVREKIGRYKYTTDADIESEYKNVEEELDKEVAAAFGKEDF